MSGPLKTYDPSKVIATVFGATAHGWADGTFITAKRAEDEYTLVVGSDGEPTRTLNLNESGEIEITLKQSSSFNDVLSAARAAKTVGPVGVSDLAGNGTTLIHCAQAWVKKVADVEFGKEVGNRVWTLSCAKLKMFVGGVGNT